MTPKIYFQTSFWEELKKDSTPEGFRTLLSVYDALLGSAVVTDVTEEYLNSEENELLKKWYKHSISHNDVELCEPKYFDSIFDGIDSSAPAEQLSATYLLLDKVKDKDDKRCDGYSNLYGICALSAKGLSKKKYLFKGDGFSLTKDTTHEKKYKEFENKLNHPCNSMIVIDPYLLTDKRNIESNLRNLLDTVLPLPEHKFKPQFHLSIISILGNPGKGIKYDPQKIYDQIESIIKQLRPELNFSLGVLYIYKGGDFHRRLVLTNTWVADFADGTDLFDEKGIAKKNTTVDVVYPRLIGDDRQDLSKYEQWIRIAKEEYKKVGENRKDDCKGFKENRLFDLVKD